MRNLIAILFALLIASPVAAQQFPQVQDKSVIGRIGTSSGNLSGPSQAIPFANLFGLGTQNQIVLYGPGGVSLKGSPILTFGTPPEGGPLIGLNVNPIPSINPNNGISLAQGTGVNGAGGTLTFWAQNGTAASPTVITNGQEIGFMQAVGWDGTAFGPPGNLTGIGFIATELWTHSANGSGILFQATPNGTTFAPNEGCIQGGLVLFGSGGNNCNTPAGLGQGTVNAINGLFDGGNRPLSISNATITKNINAEADLIFSNNSTGTAALTAWQTANSNGGAIFGIGGSAYAGAITGIQNRAFVGSGTGLSGVTVFATGTNPIDFNVNNARAGGFTSAGLLTLTTPLAAGSGGTGLSSLGTGVAAALGTNVGSAGAPVLFNGAGGTPSAVTLTNGTGLPATGLTGTLQAAQEPAHTGDCTNSAGSLALACGVQGTWTPTIVGETTPGTGQTYAAQVGTYQKIGREVTARFSITLTSLGTAAGNADLGGLPFTSSATANVFGGCLIESYSITSNTGTGIGAVINTSATVAQLLSHAATAVTQLTTTNVGATGILRGVCFYQSP